MVVVVSCALTAILATHLWINGVNQLVTVCEYRCPKKVSSQYYYNPAQFAITYGSECPPYKKL